MRAQILRARQPGCCIAVLNSFGEASGRPAGLAWGSPLSATAPELILKLLKLPYRSCVPGLMDVLPYRTFFLKGIKD